MDMRNDAFMGLADFAHEVPRILEENGSDRSRATIGKVGNGFTLFGCNQNLDDLPLPA